MKASNRTHKEPKPLTLKPYRKLTGKFEPLRFTSQAGYLGLSRYTLLPILPATVCTCKAQVLTFKCGGSTEQLVLESRELGEQICKRVVAAQCGLKARCIARSVELLEQAVYFVSCTFMDVWSTNRSRAPVGKTGPLGGKEKKVVWVDKAHSSLYIGTDKCKIKGAAKVPIGAIESVKFEICGDRATYRIVIAQKGRPDDCHVLFTSDFMKVSWWGACRM